MEGGRLFYKRTASCAPQCDSGDVNAFDRVTAGTWSPAWQHASSYVLAVQGAGAAALLFADEGFQRGLNDAVVVGESALLSVGVGSMIALAVQRPQPFLYGQQGARRCAHDQRRQPVVREQPRRRVVRARDVDGGRDVHRLHPGTRAPWIVSSPGGAAGVFVATARVLGGMHFITDVIGGAVVGSSVGVLLPALHASPVAVGARRHDGRPAGPGVHGALLTRAIPSRINFLAAAASPHPRGLTHLFGSRSL